MIHSTKRRALLQITDPNCDFTEWSREVKGHIYPSPTPPKVEDLVTRGYSTKYAHLRTGNEV